MMPLVDPPKVFGMGDSMYPIMAKIGQDEISSDSSAPRGKLATPAGTKSWSITKPLR